MDKMDFNLWLMTLWPIIGTAIMLFFIYIIYKAIVWIIKKCVKEEIAKLDNRKV